MKKKTVTIGIPAYNEGKNIKNLLNSILMQKEEGFVIEKIIVVLDGCTDNTFKATKQIKDKRIVLIKKKKRYGKSATLNQIIKLSSEDILVLLDADIVLYSKTSIKELVKIFKNNTGLASGRLLPHKNLNFLQKCIVVSIETYVKFFEQINKGKNIYACKGAVLALSKKFYKTLVIPKRVIANDAFLYLTCIKNGFKFKYVRKNLAWYGLPATIHDQIKQNQRFVSTNSEMQKYFGDLAKREFEIEQTLLFKLMFYQFAEDPFHSFPIFIINFFSRFNAQFSSNLENTWFVKTTKGGINE